MTPEGRKTIRLPGSKWKPKHNGKNVPGWWEDIAPPCKRRARQESRTEIKREVNELP